MTIAPKPVVLTRGRFKTVWVTLNFDATGVEFICDLKYKVGQDPVFTLLTNGSPPSIIVDTENEMKIGLVFTGADTELAAVDVANSNLDFPFVKMVGELCYMEDGNKIELFKFIAHVYEEVTTTDG